MKKLLLITLLFIGVNCYGQSNRIQEDFIGYDTTIIEVPTDFPNYYLYNYSSMVTLLYYWDKYSIECYNDSSYIKYQVDTGNYLVFKVSSKWIHKQPTFTDFMGWLKKKYK